MASTTRPLQTIGGMVQHSNERGAVAVEFAILLPVLLMLLLGVVEFGRAFNAQISLAQAAREGVRIMAITDSAADARQAARNAAPSLVPADMTIEIVSFEPDPSDATTYLNDCVAEKPVRVTITYQLDSITGFFGNFNLEGTGVMRCGG